MKRSYQPTIPKERTRRLQGPVLIVYAFTITVFIFAFIVFAQFTAKRQGDLLYQEKIQAGKIGLNHFLNKAAIPLLDDDALSLNALLKEAIPYQCTYLYRQEILLGSVLKKQG